jgi:hypothetical protein
MQPHNSLINEDQGAFGRVSVKLFLRITDEWDLTDRERCILAGVESRQTIHTWRNKVERGDGLKLQPPVLERLSYIAGIYKALQLLFNDPAVWKNWVRKPNAHFNGKSALERMLSGLTVELASVRRYLDQWRGEVYL